MNRNGHTIVLITHDMDVARRAGRTVVMRDGELTEGRGEPHEAQPGIGDGVQERLVEQA
ncbi:hypothetical protein [Paenibacillus sp. PL2-23]|uniref:hypothetical protein n=1 Tax=Paenibacillus sp. PL2-23 TaxID=2100729 RepID=UPI0030FD1D38